jgi:hypothetical protein
MPGERQRGGGGEQVRKWEIATKENPKSQKPNLKKIRNAVVLGSIPVTVSCPLPSFIRLTPGSATNLVGQAHTVCASLYSVSANGTNVIVGDTVTFNVTNGPNATVHGTSVTDSNGVACFTYVGTGGVGTDIIDASFFDANTNRISTFATKVWVPANHPPVAVCTNVIVSADSSHVYPASS